MSIHEMMAEKMELAGIYAQDGGFRSAARILANLSCYLEAHADRVDGALAHAIEARRAETAKTGSVHESAVVADDAPIMGKSDQEGA